MWRRECRRCEVEAAEGDALGYRSRSRQTRLPEASYKFFASFAPNRFWRAILMAFAGSAERRQVSCEFHQKKRRADPTRWLVVSRWCSCPCRPGPLRQGSMARRRRWHTEARGGNSAPPVFGVPQDLSFLSLSLECFRPSRGRKRDSTCRNSRSLACLHRPIRAQHFGETDFPGRFGL